MSIRQVIGLEDPDRGDFGRFHGKRYQLVAQRAYTRVLIHGIAMCAVLWLCWSRVPHPLLWAWAGLLGSVLAMGFVLDRKLKDADERTLTSAELRRHALMGAAKGAIWSGGLGVFVFTGAQGMVAQLWAFLAFVVMVGSVSRFCAPLTIIAFTLSACTGMLVTAIASGYFGIAAIIVATAAFGCLGVIE